MLLGGLCCFYRIRLTLGCSAHTLACRYARCARISLRFEIKHLAAVIKAAVEAHVVWTVMTVAVLADRHFRVFKRVMRAPIAGMRPRMSHAYYHNAGNYSKVF